jgi:hypothetical protein
MCRSWIATSAYALAAQGLLTASAWATDDGYRTQGSPVAPGLERRVADLEAELARTRQTVEAQQAALERHDGQLTHLPPVESKTPAAESARRS